MKTLARPLAALALLLAGCGSATQQPSAHAAATRAVGPPRAVAGASCPATVARALGGIALRIYGQAAHGRNVVSAQRRLARSRRLSVAVAAADPAATRAALLPLLKHQIRSIEITRGAHRLATVTGPPALAPVRGLIRDARGRPVGRYVLAVAQDGAVARITHALLGGRVELRDARGAAVATAGGNRSSGPSFAFRARAYPSGALTVALRLPAVAPAACAATPQATVAATIGAVGERLARTEARGPTVRRVLRHVATDPRFARAVATDDPVALRAAIIRFFRTRSLHVVRVRATMADGRLVGDVGGPYVLCPASRTLRDAGGRPLGTVTLSVQDDTGYIKLMRRFTGAAVVLRTVAGTVPGSTLMPGPAIIPARGRLNWDGRTFDTYTFTAGAFPSGPLTVALLI